MQPSPWRWPTAQQNSPPRLPFLNHSASLVDLHDSRWPWKYGRPSSPTESSSSSSASNVLTPTQSTIDYSESRSSTPTPSTPPQIFSTITYTNFASKNPWRNLNHEGYSPQLSPKSSPFSTSPNTHSRASTPTASMASPIAPQPVRPPAYHSATDPMSYEPAWSRPSPPPLMSPTPLPSNEIENDKLRVQPITPELISHVVKLIPRIITRYGWKIETANWVYQWAIQQPKTALLLWMCDDLQAWKRAGAHGLKDNAMPFEAHNLHGIVSSPEQVVKLQWKVAMRPLPRDGGHVEFQTQEHVPVKEIGALVEDKAPSKTLTKVQYLDGSDSQFYVRKRFEISADRPQDKTTILDQIKKFNRLEHDNLAKIMSSYARGSVVAFITPLATCNLAQYLAEVEDLSHSELIMSWATDLCSALAYLHHKRLEHKNIRPQKILVDTVLNRVSISVFGTSLPARSSSYSYLYRPYSEEPAYIYAAPEIVARRDIHQREVRQAADVFSLGCCLLDMLTVAKGYRVSKATKYRSSVSHDLSFHANLDRVHVWIKQLAAIKIASAASRRNTVYTSPNAVLRVVQSMLTAEPDARPTMKQVVREIESPSAYGLSMRRNSDVVMSSNGSRMAVTAPTTTSPPVRRPRDIPRPSPARSEYSVPTRSSPPGLQEFTRPSPPRQEYRIPRPSPPRSEFSVPTRSSPPGMPEFPRRSPPKQEYSIPRPSPPRSEFAAPTRSSPPGLAEFTRRSPPKHDYSIPRPSPPRSEFSAPTRSSPPGLHEFARHSPPKQEYSIPRDSNIWDLQSLSDYDWTPAVPEYSTTAASVYDDGFYQA